MTTSTMKHLIAQVEELQTELRALKLSRRERQAASAPDGREQPDQTPVEIPVGFDQPPTLTELVQQTVRTVMSNQAAEEGLGTFEEEDDFAPENEDLLFLSGFEVTEYEMEDEAPLEDAIADPSTQAETLKTDLTPEDASEASSSGSEATANPAPSPVIPDSPVGAP